VPECGDVVLGGQVDLTNLVPAFGAACGVTHGLDRWEQNRHQDSDDPDHNQ